jgi:8-hydroxy-5-deazaflavin:NADPH oxidoreductase
MKIAILGAGNIGATLGKKWLAAGHELVFGVRDSTSLKTKTALENTGGKIPAVSVEEAVRFGEVILLSVPWGKVPEVLTANAAGLANKIIVDATNNFSGPVISNLDLIREQVPTAVLYRAFNSLGWEVFANPQFGEVQVDMFYCGPEGPQRKAMDELITEIGLRPIWIGDNDRAAIVDHMGSLWIALVAQGGWQRRHIAFKLLE